MSWLQILLIAGLLGLSYWVLDTLRLCRRAAIRAEKALFELAPDWWDDDRSDLPALNESEYNQIGDNMVHAHVLPGEWERVWRREVRHAQAAKAVAGAKAAKTPKAE